MFTLEIEMKFWHYLLIKSFLCFVAFAFGTQDMAFFWVATLSLIFTPIFFIANE